MRYSYLHYTYIVSVGLTSNALLRIAGCPILNALLGIAGCPTTPNALLRIFECPTRS